MFVQRLSRFSRNSQKISLLQCQPFSNVVESVNTIPMNRIKHKVPKRRASSLMAELQSEQLSSLKGARNLDVFQVGDSIELTRLPFISSPNSETVKGLVIGKYNKGPETSFMMINNEYGTPIYRRIALYHPLNQEIKVLKKAFIHEGKREGKKVRRAKLYYFMDKDPDFYVIN